MSNSHPTAAAVATSSANFQVIFNNALKAYERRTKKDLLSHPLAVELQACNSPSAILVVLRQQVPGSDPSLCSDDRWTKWLEPTVNVLHTLSDTLGEGVSLSQVYFSPETVIFAGVGVLLSAAKDVQRSRETLVDIFGCIENCFQRIEIYTQVRPTAEMMDTIIQIMVEVLTILGIATKEMKQGRIKRYGKRLIGRTDLDDALSRLDKLTHEEARMAIAENLRATHAVDERVKGVTEQVLVVDDRVARVDDRLANVNDKVTEVIHSGNEPRQVMEQTAKKREKVPTHVRLAWHGPVHPPSAIHPPSKRTVRDCTVKRSMQHGRTRL